MDPSSAVQPREQQTKKKKKYPEPTPELYRIIEKFRLSDKDMEQLYNRFLDIDEDKSGEIDIDEFAALFGRKRDMYVEGLFDLVLGLAEKYTEEWELQRQKEEHSKQALEEAKLRGGDTAPGRNPRGAKTGDSPGKSSQHRRQASMDHNNATTSMSIDSIITRKGATKKSALSFDDFVRTCMTYCMFEEAIIILFTFNLFDTDHSGTLTPDEMKHLVRIVHNLDASQQRSSYITNLSKQMMLTFDENGDGKLDFEEFKVLVRQNPRLLFPAFDLQTSMQKATMGVAWFKRWMQRRAQQRAKQAESARKQRELEVREAAKREAAEEKILAEAEQAYRESVGLSRMVGCCCCRYDALEVTAEAERMILEEERKEANIRKYGTPEPPPGTIEEAPIVSKVRLRKRNQRPSFRPGSRRVKTQEEKEREWERKRHKMKLETESAAGEDDEEGATIKAQSTGRARRRRRRQSSGGNVNKTNADGSYYDEFGFLVEAAESKDYEDPDKGPASLTSAQSRAISRVLGPKPDVTQGASRSAIRDYQRAQQALAAARKEREEKKRRKQADKDRKALLKLAARGPPSKVEADPMAATELGAASGMNSSPTDMRASFHRHATAPPLSPTEKQKQLAEADAHAAMIAKNKAQHSNALDAYHEQLKLAKALAKKSGRRVQSAPVARNPGRAMGSKKKSRTTLRERVCGLLLLSFLPGSICEI
eukprot:INCI16284.16.p1 GENE.INCI16284.16~~INCI16284.16.p1  ORF type:complete len:824 (-),score=160.67 INCI16284.16:1745-3868(-)